MVFTFYRFRREHKVSKKMKVQQDKTKHWIIVTDQDPKHGYCSECQYQNCMHSQAFINPNVGTIFMEHLPFKEICNVDYPITDEEQIEDACLEMMLILSVKPDVTHVFIKEKFTKILDELTAPVTSISTGRLDGN